MNERLELRLKELRTEFEAGQKALAELEAKQLKLSNTMLRISGAIQVLEELLQSSNLQNSNGSRDTATQNSVSP